MSVTPIDCNYVRKAIQRPKNGKAPGPDKIPIVLIKDVTDLIHQPLTMIFNSSSSSGKASSLTFGKWQSNHYFQIRSGSRSHANNYRSISAVSVFSRILERIVHGQIHEHLKATKALTMSQSAFQECCSTITSLIDSTDKWYENINDRQLNLTIFLDLKMAFDTFNLAILMGNYGNTPFEILLGTGFNHISKIGNSTVPQMASIRGLEL